MGCCVVWLADVKYEHTAKEPVIYIFMQKCVGSRFLCNICDCLLD